MTDRLGELGYAFASVNPIPRIDRDRRVVDFTLQVDPGRRVYVRRINISGNAKTRDEVIRREMRQYEASWYDSERIRLSRNRIDRLGYFKQVEIDTEPVPGTTDQVDVNVELEERPLGSLTLGVGFSSSENLVLSGSISQQNFMGTGTNLSVEVNTSKVSQVFAISHVDPYWTDDGVSRSLDLYTRTFNADELDSLGNYRIKSQGIGMRFGIPYTEEDRIFLGVSYDNSELSGTVPENFTPGDSIVLSAGWSKDTRNSALAPTSGGYQFANADYGTPAGDLEYIRLTYGHQRFTPLTRNLTLALNAELGYGIGLSGQDYPRIKNFYVGGIGSVRGFSSSSIGEKVRRTAASSATDLIAIGGNRKLVLNGELLTPLPGMAQDRTIRVFTFLDVGSAWGESQTVSSDDLRVSTGFGLSWFSPVGPLKLSWAQPVRKKPGDDTQTIQFQIGTGF
jgi:outer membrane protein insertion porin family